MWNLFPTWSVCFGVRRTWFGRISAVFTVDKRFRYRVILVARHTDPWFGYREVLVAGQGDCAILWCVTVVHVFKYHVVVSWWQRRLQNKDNVMIFLIHDDKVVFLSVAVHNVHPQKWTHTIFMLVTTPSGDHANCTNCIANGLPMFFWSQFYTWSKLMI